jgi:hypothetical protein
VIEADGHGAGNGHEDGHEPAGEVGGDGGEQAAIGSPSGDAGPGQLPRGDGSGDSGDSGGSPSS